MKEISGSEFKKRLNEFYSLSALLYYDGPLISHETHISNPDLAVVWYVIDLQMNFESSCYMVVDSHCRDMYINGKLSLFDLLSISNESYFVCENLTKSSVSTIVYTFSASDTPLYPVDFYYPEPSSYLTND